MPPKPLASLLKCVDGRICAKAGYATRDLATSERCRFLCFFGCAGNAVAREAGFAAVLGKLEPLGASPMNDVLLGWPSAAAAMPYRDLAPEG